jgi:hypothetical protein
MSVPNELVPLSAAAAKAYLALGDAGRTPLADGVLDVVAIALAACMPIYGARAPEEALERLADADLAGGKFIQGAATLHFSSGAKPFVRLAVGADELATGMECLKRAGVNFSQARFEHAPRRIPRVAPA